MLLALDVGNSSVKGALWGGSWETVQRWDHGGVGSWAERLRSIGDLEAVGIASVVPAITDVLFEAAERVGVPVVSVSTDLRLPFRLDYQTPHTLGADRLAAAVGGHALAEGRAVVVVDAGTAITTDIVTAEPAYIGGAILPGPDLLRRSLARDTGQLPDVPWPDAVTPIGSSTVEAIQAGIGTLVLEGVTGLLARTLEAVGRDALVVATGGWAEWLAVRISLIERCEPRLVLEGVRLLTDQSRSSSD